MYSEAAIEAESVSKVYLLYNKPEDRLKQMLLPRLKRLAASFLGRFLPRLRVDTPRYREFWALRNVSVSLKPRETLGIIGQNGSGKSTLLQIICGTLTPSSGTVGSQGRVAALLELGAGFNPDFTGRENVYLNAAIYGLTTTEIDSRMQAIIEFAEIGEHIDQPVKTYSSGMFVRLAFSVIANIDADILVIDEALAVGDVYFQQKCMRFLRKFQEHGSIFFVSHDTGAMMSFCDRVIWLHHGAIRSQGNPREVCEEYLAFLYERDQTAVTREKAVSVATEPSNTTDEVDSDTLRVMSSARDFGDRAAEIISCNLLSVDGQVLKAINGNEAVRLVVRFRTKRPIRSAIVGFILKDRLGQYILGDNTFESTSANRFNVEADCEAEASFSFIMPKLAPGTYSIAPSVASGTLNDHIQHHWIHDALVLPAYSNIQTGVLINIPIEANLKALSS